MNKISTDVKEWENSNIQFFWGEIAPCDHLVQIYENDRIFLDTLEGFAGAGLLAGDSVIIIATSGHLEALSKRLTAQGMNLDTLAASDQYITMDVEEALSKIFINQWPDESLFNNFVIRLLHRARQGGRKVRAFGEIVAVLWEQGHNGATVQLENLWHRIQNKELFTLYCAYPKSGFTQHAQDSLGKICSIHSKVIDGQARPATEIYYRSHPGSL